MDETAKTITNILAIPGINTVGVWDGGEDHKPGDCQGKNGPCGGRYHIVTGGSGNVANTGSGSNEELAVALEAALKDTAIVELARRFAKTIEF